MPTDHRKNINLGLFHQRNTQEMPYYVLRGQILTFLSFLEVKKNPEFLGLKKYRDTLPRYFCTRNCSPLSMTAKKFRQKEARFNISYCIL